MSKLKKKECWLERWDKAYTIWIGGTPERLGRALRSFYVRNWHEFFAPPGSPLRMKSYGIRRISITPTKTGFSVRAIGKAQKI